MRTSEQRVEELHQRMADRQWNKVRRQYMIKSTVACAACLTITVILAFVISSIPVQTPVAGTGGYTASIFANYETLGYVVLALLAFCLGALVTIICFRMRKRLEEMQDDRKL